MLRCVGGAMLRFVPDDTMRSKVLLMFVGYAGDHLCTS